MNSLTGQQTRMLSGFILAAMLLGFALLVAQSASESIPPAGKKGTVASPPAGGRPLQSGSAAAWVARGNRSMQQARTTQSGEDYRRAEVAYRQALAVDPADAAAMSGLAWVHGGRHEFEQSIHWARKAIELAPDQTGAYGLWGDALVEMGDYDGAFVRYQQMMNLRPDLAAYSRSAHLLFLTGATDDALMLMQKAISAGGPYAENMAWCRAQLALMLYHLGRCDRAEALLVAALREAPDNYHLLTAMAKVQAALKNYPAAIGCYEAAITRVPQPATITALGDLYRLTGRLTAAERQFSWAEAIWRLRAAGGWQPDIHRARFYAEHDRNLDQALAAAEKLYRTRRNILVADTLAWCYHKSGRYAEARTMIKQALRLGTPDARLYYHAGMIHARLGESALARQYLQRALALSPNFHPVCAVRAADTFQRLRKRG